MTTPPETPPPNEADPEDGPGTSALAREWERLHPLSPLVRFGRSIGILILLVLFRIASSQDLTSTWIDAAVIVLALIAAVVHWLVTRWRVHDGELQIETGLLRRQSIRVPLARIQAVDVVRPALGRMCGLAEVRVDLAGHGSGRGRLAYLPDAQAVRVRAQLLAAAHGLADDTPAPPATPIWAVDNGRLVASAALGTPTAVFAILLAGLIVTGVFVPAALPAVIGSVIPWMVIAALVPVRRVLAEGRFRAAEAGDGLRLEAGLLQTRAQTIPFGRVQAVRVTQRLLWRPLGWYRLEVDVARQRSGRHGSESDSAQLSRALLPIGTAGEVDRLLSRVLPGARWRPPEGSGAPRRAILKAPFSYHLLATWHDADHVAARTGRIRRHTVIAPLAKAQSVRYSQGPVQRALRLATVHVDTAGRGWRATARCREAPEAESLLHRLATDARTARKKLTVG